MAIYTIRKSLFDPDRKFQSLYRASYVAPVVSKPGMVLINPTSISYSGTSATKGTNGQVTFNAVTSLSLNGVFTGDFDNYVAAIRGTGTSGGYLYSRLRASGTDNSTASSYVTQELYASNAFISAARATSDTARVTYWAASLNYAFNFSLYGPYLSQPTAWRTVVTGGQPEITEEAGTHNQSTAYDGFTLYPTTGSITGALQVYGIRS